MAAADAIQRRLVRSALSLPAPLLRAASGGRAVYAGGRTLDPRFQMIMFAARQRAGSEDAESFPLLRGGPEPGVDCQPVAIDGPRGPIRALLHRPRVQAAARPILVFAGVDCEASAPDPMQALCGMVAAAAGCAVLSLRHTLSHGVGLDAGLEDLVTVLRWAQENGVAYGAAERLAAVGGVGLGGNLAAVTCQLLKSMGERQPELQLLLYPALDMAGESGSAGTYAEAAVLSPALRAWREGRLIGPEDSPLDPRVSPLRAHDVSGLAPAVIATAGFDPVLDDGEAYVRRLRGAGVEVRYRCYDALPHGFAGFTAASPAAEAACREVAAVAAVELGRRAPVSPA